MHKDWAAWLERWKTAGLVDAGTAARIEAFEASQSGATRLRWPIVIALGFGGLMIVGGILLFVAANWDVLSPGQRFALVLLLVGSFHVGGALTADRFHAMSETLHACGTVALGAGIALGGQIFNLAEHWPGGVLLWAAGAAIAWALLRHTAQLAITAVLGPAWLVSEWFVAAGPSRARWITEWIPASFVLLLALTYITAAGQGRADRYRTAFLWIGCAGLAVSAPALALIAGEAWTWRTGTLPDWLLAVGWTCACGIPLAAAAVLRGTAAWANALAVVWIVGLAFIGRTGGRFEVYPWWALGAVGLVAWGIRDGRAAPINLGALTFAATVLAFYFSQVMDKLGRSASLVGLGVLFLGGGWALERARRRLVDRSRELA
jgi:uncharacterized membrane protein